MNKILIALVLAVVMSSNAYAKDKLYYICIDGNGEETWTIDKSKESAYRYYIYKTGRISDDAYELRFYEYVIQIGKEYHERISGIKKFRPVYKLDRRTLELKSIADYSDDRARVDTKFCKVSEELETIEFRKIISTARKLEYEKSLKF